MGRAFKPLIVTPTGGIFAASLSHEKTRHAHFQRRQNEIRPARGADRFMNFEERAEYPNEMAFSETASLNVLQPNELGPLPGPSVG